MIISNSKKFIFIKPRKCASTSIERVLLKTLSKNDITTDESNPNFGKKKFLWNKLYHNFKQPIKKYFFKKKKVYKKLKVYDFEYKVNPHVSINDLYKIIPKNKFNDYLKISIIRNPFEMFLSAANQKYSSFNISLNEKVKKFSQDFFRINQVYLINGRPFIDFLIRYENIEYDFNSLVKRLNLNPDLNSLLKKTKINDPKDIGNNNFKLHTLDEYNDQSIEYIKSFSNYFNIIYKHFGYSNFYKEEYQKIENLVKKKNLH